MGNFSEAIKTDANLQKQVVAAIKKVAADNGLTIDDKPYAADGVKSLSCVNACGTLCVCSA